MGPGTDRVAGDIRYCRAALPRVSRTFAINIRLLTGSLGDAVRVGYLLCRAADTLEDSWPARDGRQAFGLFLASLEGDARAATKLGQDAGRLGVGPELDLVANLPRVLRARDALPEAHREQVTWGARTLSVGMERYASRSSERPPGAPYLDDESELDDYCWVVAGCVGVMLTRLYAAEYGVDEPAAQERRLALAPVVGRALQLTNILLDWPIDLRRGRCYLPATWLHEHGLRPAALVERERPGVRALVRRLEEKALADLARVPDYLDLIPLRRLRYRLFCLWPALWAVGSLRNARRDPEFPWGPRRPKLSRFEILRASIGSLFATDHGGALRRECATPR